MGLTVNQKKEGDQTVISLEGGIDEDAVFPTLEAGAQKILLDFEKVAAINSVGIREWIKWTKSFPAGSALSVRNCPKIIVDQVNMVAGFLPAGTDVQSFYVPYYSDASGEEKMVLFQKGKEFNGSELTPPEEVKSESGEVMEMDVIETKYFKFLGNG